MKKLFTLLITLFWVTTLLNAAAITSFAPTSGPVGTEVTITGTGFNTTAANNVVFFGATQATVMAASSTSLTVTVPIGATYAPVTELNTGLLLAAYNTTSFIPTYKGTGSLTGNDFSPKPNLVVTNKGASSVSMLLNTCSVGEFSFSAKTDFATGTSLFRVLNDPFSEQYKQI